MIQEILQVCEVQASKEVHAEKIAERRIIDSPQRHAESYTP